MTESRREELYKSFSAFDNDALIHEAIRLQGLLDDVDDVLVVNWVDPPSWDNGFTYKDVLNKLIIANIEIHDYMRMFGHKNNPTIQPIDFKEDN